MQAFKGAIPLLYYRIKGKSAVGVVGKPLGSKAGRQNQVLEGNFEECIYRFVVDYDGKTYELTVAEELRNGEESNMPEGTQIPIYFIPEKKDYICTVSSLSDIKKWLICFLGCLGASVVMFFITVAFML